MIFMSLTPPTSAPERRRPQTPWPAALLRLGPLSDGGWGAPARLKPKTTTPPLEPNKQPTNPQNNKPQKHQNPHNTPKTQHPKKPPQPQQPQTKTTTPPTPTAESRLAPFPVGWHLLFRRLASFSLSYSLVILFALNEAFMSSLIPSSDFSPLAAPFCSDTFSARFSLPQIRFYSPAAKMLALAVKSAGISVPADL